MTTIDTKAKDQAGTPKIEVKPAEAAVKKEADTKIPEAKKSV